MPDEQCTHLERRVYSIMLRYRASVQTSPRNKRFLGVRKWGLRGKGLWKCSRGSLGIKFWGNHLFEAEAVNNLQEFRSPVHQFWPLILLRLS